MPVGFAALAPEIPSNDGSIIPLRLHVHEQKPPVTEDVELWMPAVTKEMVLWTVDRPREGLRCAAPAAPNVELWTQPVDGNIWDKGLTRAGDSGFRRNPLPAQALDEDRPGAVLETSVHLN